MPSFERRRSWTLLLRLLPAVAFAIVAAAGTSAGAAPIPGAHGEACACGMHCRPKACCCGPKRTARRADRPAAPDAPAVEAPDAPSGPCLGEAPGGGDVAPVKTATVDRGEAAWVGLDPIRSTAAAHRLPPPSSDRSASVDPSRLDRPPR